MKKIILLALAALMMVGCDNTDANGHIKLDGGFDTPGSFIIDSCEYISWVYGFTHKGNCRFCKERRQQELKELVEQLKRNNYGNN